MFIALLHILQYEFILLKRKTGRAELPNAQEIQVSYVQHWGLNSDGTKGHVLFTLQKQLPEYQKWK